MNLKHSPKRMEGLKLETLGYSFPSADDPEIQAKLYNKEEFRQLTLQPKESISFDENFFVHQIFARRFMREYDKLCVLHEVGTGKTRFAISAAEYFRDHPELGINKCVILTHNETIGRQFKNEIIQVTSFAQFAGEKLTTSWIKGQITRTLQSINVKTNGEVRSRPFSYEITTQITFGNKIANRSDKILQNEYSGTLFVIDEVHKIASRELTKAKWDFFYKERDIIEHGNEETKHDFFEFEEENHGPVENIAKASRGELAYMRIYHLFHLVKKSKKMLLTATPMENDPSEFAPIIDLLTPKHMKLDIVKDKKWWDTVNSEELEPYLRGKVSYLRQMDIGVDLKLMGKLLKYEVDGKEVERIIYTSEMSPFQKDIYRKELKNMSAKDRGLAVSLKHISNFVLPDGSFGKLSLNKYLSPDRFILKEILPSMTREFKDAFSLENLDKYSPKYKSIFMIVDAPENKHKACLIYTPFVDTGSRILTAIFYINGYHVFSTEKEANRHAEYDYRRFSTITTKTPAELMSEIFTVFKSPENWDGKIIKVMIGSQFILTGLNIGNVSIFQSAGPEWTEAKNYQAMGRGLRAVSHRYILEKLKEQAKERGEDTSNIRTTFDIYQHAAVFDFDDLLTSINIRMYGKAQNKHKKIVRIIRILKENSVDCHITRARNVRSYDARYSQERDYMEYPYECRIPIQKNILVDYTSFNVLYIDNVVKQLIDSIIPLFQEKASYSLNYVVDIIERNWDARKLNLQLDQVPKSYIMQALFRLINNKIPVHDRFGITRYVREQGGQLFLRGDYPIRSSGDRSSRSYYIENITATYKGREIQKPKINTKSVNELFKSPVTKGRLSAKFWEKYDNLEVPEKIMLLEKIIFAYIAESDADHNTMYEMLMGRLKMFVLRDDDVFVHIMNNQIKTNKSNYTVTSGYTKIEGFMRILRSRSDERIQWKDATAADEAKYSSKILNHQKKIEEPFNENKIYGIISTADGNFRIRKRSKGWKLLNRKELSRGSVCKNTDKHKLMDSILEYNIQIPHEKLSIPSLNQMKEKLRDDNVNIHGKNREQMLQLYKKQIILDDKYPRKRIEELIMNEGFSSYKFDLLYDWTLYRKEPVCKTLREYFLRNNLMLYI